MNEKYLLNALRVERFDKLSIEERGVLVRKIKHQFGYTNRSLSEITGIPHSTLHDWASGRQDNTGTNIHISLPNIARKLKEFKPKTQMDVEILKNILKYIKQMLRDYK